MEDDVGFEVWWKYLMRGGMSAVGVVLGDDGMLVGLGDGGPFRTCLMF